MDLKLAGKVVLITGSSRGIGLATAKAFAAEDKSSSTIISHPDEAGNDTTLRTDTR
jgi:NAD(P)-dependent dehydrogenase (short-subunit alcohol dehydrogenase family)